VPHTFLSSKEDVAPQGGDAGVKTGWERQLSKEENSMRSVSKPTGEWANSNKPIGLNGKIIKEKLGALEFQDKKDKANLKEADRLKNKSS